MDGWSVAAKAAAGIAAGRGVVQTPLGIMGYFIIMENREWNVRSGVSSNGPAVRGQAGLGIGAGLLVAYIVADELELIPKETGWLARGHFGIIYLRHRLYGESL
jgi:hypothetical protein